MAQERTRKPPTKGRRKPSDNGGEPKPTEPEVEVEQPNGFMVHRLMDAEGNIQVITQPVGDVKMTEAPAVLGMALNDVKGKMGLT